jgi:hypothetical protein
MTTAKGTNMIYKTQTRYTIEKNEWTPDEQDCFHRYCDRFHANGCPAPGMRREWYILDHTTGDRANINSAATYNTKREAVAELELFLERGW